MEEKKERTIDCEWDPSGIFRQLKFLLKTSKQRATPGEPPDQDAVERALARTRQNQ